MQFDVDQLTAKVTVGEMAHFGTRKARKGDCICSNESAYYPPLTKLRRFCSRCDDRRRGHRRGDLGTPLVDSR